MYVDCRPDPVLFRRRHPKATHNTHKGQGAPQSGQWPRRLMRRSFVRGERPRTGARTVRRASPRHAYQKLRRSSPPPWSTIARLMNLVSTSVDPIAGGYLLRASRKVAAHIRGASNLLCQSDQAANEARHNRRQGADDADGPLPPRRPPRLVFGPPPYLLTFGPHTASSSK